MSALLFTSGKFRGCDENNVPLVGGKLYAYAAGTDTPQATYTDSSGVSANTNPVILDAAGEANVYLDGTYKLVLTDANDVPQWEIDNILGATSVLSTITATSTSSVAIAIAPKTFETQSGKAFPIGGFVIVNSNADPTDYMFGQVTAYNDTTLEVDVSVIGGSGTFDDWTISLSGPAGPTGPTGPSGGGTGDMVGSANLQVGVGGVANAATARGNLGLGGAAVLDAGTSANNVVQLDGSANLPALNAAALTALNASNLTSGTAPAARLGSGSAGAGAKVLYDNQTWGTPSAPTDYLGIGTSIFAMQTAGGAGWDEGMTYAGSKIRAMGLTFNSGGAVIDKFLSSTAPSGTWRAMGPSQPTGAANTYATLFTRTA